MDVKFSDICHINVRGKAIYRDSINSLKRYRSILNVAKKYSKTVAPSILGVAGMLTMHQMQRLRTIDTIKLTRAMDEYKKRLSNEVIL